MDTLVIGLVAMDSISTLSAKPVLGESNPGRLRSSVGGVGYNVCLAHQYGLQSQGRHETVRFVSAVGDDLPGTSVLRKMGDSGSDASGLKILPNVETAQYSAILDLDGSLVVACADMAIVESDALVQHLENEITRAQPRVIVVDCNLLVRALDTVLATARTLTLQPKVVIEPTSVPKLARISQVNSRRLGVYPHNTVDMITPTAAELAQIHASFATREFFDDYDNWFPVLDSLGIDATFREKMAALAAKNDACRHMLAAGTLQQAFQLLPYIPNILVKLGDKGCAFIRICANANDYKSVPTTSKYAPTFTLVSQGKQFDEKRVGIVVDYFAVPSENENLTIVDVTGAGDSLVGYLTSTLYKENWLGDEVLSLEQEWWRWEAVHKAQLASGKSLQSTDAISTDIRKIQ